jgi:hypothetical protein
LDQSTQGELLGKSAERWRKWSAKKMAATASNAQRIAWEKATGRELGLGVESGIG